jgi:hypothetical protein
MPASDLAVTTSNRRARATQTEHAQAEAALVRAQEAFDQLERQADALAERVKLLRGQRAAAETQEAFERFDADLSVVTREHDFAAQRVPRVRADVATAQRAVDMFAFSDSAAVATGAQRALKAAAVAFVETVSRSQADMSRAQDALEAAAADFQAARGRHLDLSAAVQRAPEPVLTHDALALAVLWVRAEFFTRRVTKFSPTRPSLYPPPLPDAGVGAMLQLARDLINAPFTAELAPETQLELLLRLDGSYEARIAELDAKKQAQIEAGRAYSLARDAERAKQRAGLDDEDDDA